MTLLVSDPRCQSPFRKQRHRERLELHARPAMEGFLVRLPAPEHDTGSSAARRRVSKNEASRFTQNRRVISGRVLYYTLGEGFLTGYLSPTDVEPVESFQLTSHKVDVDVMYSTQVFQVFARRLSSPVAAASRPAIIPHSDSSDDDDDEGEDDEDGNIAHDDYNTRVELDGDYSVVFFAATKELVRLWSTKILNWNRYVFADPSGGGGFSDDSAIEDPAALQDAHEAVVQAFRASSVGDMFSPRVRLHPLATTGLPSPPPSPPKASQSSSPQLGLPTTESVVEHPKMSPDDVDASKASTATEPPSRPWWMHTAQSRRISSHSLKK